MWYSIATVENLEIDLDHANIDLMLHLYDIEQDPKDSLLRIVPAFLAHRLHEEMAIERMGLKVPENHKKEHLTVKEVRMRSKVIFIDDDESALKVIRKGIRAPGVDAEYFTSAMGALDYMNHHRVDIAISSSDLKTSDMGSMAFFKRVRRDHPDVRRIMLSDSEDDINISLGLLTGTVDDCLSKTWSVDALLSYCVFGKIYA